MSLKIEVGGVYRTRHGRKATVVYRMRNNDTYPLIVALDNDTDVRMTIDGKEFLGGQTSWDLVAPRQDSAPPVYRPWLFDEVKLDAWYRQKGYHHCHRLQIVDSRDGVAFMNGEWHDLKDLLALWEWAATPFAAEWNVCGALTTEPQPRTPA